VLRLFGDQKIVELPDRFEDVENIGAVEDDELTIDDVRAIADAHRDRTDHQGSKTYYLVYVGGVFVAEDGPRPDILAAPVGDGVVAVFADGLRAIDLPARARARDRARRRRRARGVVRGGSTVTELGHADLARFIPTAADEPELVATNVIDVDPLSPREVRADPDAVLEDDWILTQTEPRVVRGWQRPRDPRDPCPD
jgi:hypothetical protein